MPRRPTVTLRAAVDEYLDDLRVMGRAPTTIDNYRAALRDFLASANPETPMTRLTAEHLYRHFYGRQGRRSAGLAERVGGATFNLRRDQHIAFLNWALRKGHLARGVTAESLMDPIGKRKTLDLERPCLTKEQAVTLLLSCSTGRDVALTAIGLALAPRAAEVTRLQIRHFRSEDNALLQRVTKHRNREMTEYVKHVPPWAGDILRDWIKDLTLSQDRTSPDPDWYLIPRMDRPPYRGEDGKWKTDRIIYTPDLPCNRPGTVVHRIVAAAGMLDLLVPPKRPGQCRRDGVGMHLLRHTAAQHLVIDTGDIRQATAMLNHAGQATTERYLRLSADRKRLADYQGTGGWLAGELATRTATPNATVVNLNDRRRGKEA